MGVSSERVGVPASFAAKDEGDTHISLPEGLQVARPGADGSQGLVGGLARGRLDLMQGR